MYLGGMLNLHDKPSQKGKMWSFKYFLGAEKASSGEIKDLHIASSM